MKKIIGYAILLSMAGGLFGLLAVTLGFKVAAIICAISVLCTYLITVALNLIQ